VEGWDSLSHISIVVGVERAFGIQFRSAEILALNDVGDFVRLVQAARA
jgi:acyl carrier protein